MISRVTLRNLGYGLLFASPFIIGMLCFIIYPIGASFYYSLTEYSVLQPASWTGVENYRALFFEDDYFWTSLYNTVYYTGFVVPLGIITGLAIALLLNMKVKGMAVYRTLYFLPVLVPVVATSILWMWVLNPQYGMLNALLDIVHIKGPPWIASPEWSKPSLILVGIWGVGQAVVIYLAGLQDVPEQLYEAAIIDGANWLQKTRHVTIPFITPVILFNLIMGVIGSFQTFTQAYIMTNGGPANSTLFYALQLYRQAFQFFRMGYASAMAWILFIIIVICTWLLFRSSARWVYYGGA
ncbi:MAG: carbohydrate ABC transporter permease [bacterium]